VEIAWRELRRQLMRLHCARHCRTPRRSHCALIAWPGVWEIRVLVDGEPILAERCARTDELFRLAERWRHSMLSDHWQQLVPRSRAQQQRIG
jgi:hypothetical protein